MEPSILSPEMAKDVANFIENFENKHKYSVNITVGGLTSSINIVDNPERVSLKDLSNFVVMCMHEFNKSLIVYNDLSNVKTRKRDVLIWIQLFSYLAWKYGYSKSNIARFLNKNHATIIHSIKTIENFRDTNDVEFVAIYKHFENYLKNYVGTTTGDTDRQTYTKSAIASICN
tara:strand:- start:4044 stop:4562 length:519 start_codon:yes stop_codon:yes gene_type:complete